MTSKYLVCANHGFVAEICKEETVMLKLHQHCVLVKHDLHVFVQLSRLKSVDFYSCWPKNKSFLSYNLKKFITSYRKAL